MKLDYFLLNWTGDIESGLEVDKGPKGPSSSIVQWICKTHKYTDVMERTNIFSHLYVDVYVWMCLYGLLLARQTETSGAKRPQTNLKLKSI